MIAGAKHIFGNAWSTMDRCDVRVSFCVRVQERPINVISTKLKAMRKINSCRWTGTEMKKKREREGGGREILKTDV